MIIDEEVEKIREIRRSLFARFNQEPRKIVAHYLKLSQSRKSKIENSETGKKADFLTTKDTNFHE